MFAFILIKIRILFWKKQEKEIFNEVSMKKLSNPSGT